MPKLVFLSSEFPPGPGGIGTHAHHVALELQKRGWDVHVSAPQELASDEDIRAFNDSLPFEVHRIKRFGLGPVLIAHRALQVSRLISRIKPDLIVGSGERMVWLAKAMGDLHRVRTAMVGHAMEFNRTPRWEYELTRRSFESAIGAICVSNYTWSRMVSCGINVRDGEVIPNGADDLRFRRLDESDARTFRRIHGWTSAKLLITVGSVHERKGQDLVIRAMPRILAVHPDVHYLVVGMPYRRAQFEKIAREVGVANHVHFFGAVDNDVLVTALNASDVFVMASQHTQAGDFEGFGIAVLEAALCGIPAVVSDNSGVVEAIEPGVSGLVAPLGDPDATADRVIELLSDPIRRTAMGATARSRALEKTWSCRGDEYDRALRRFLNGKHERDN